MLNITRRQFIKSTAAVGAACTVGFPSLIRAKGLNEKLQVGFIAASGRADAHTDFCHNAGLQCIAFAEIDKTLWKGVHGKKGWEQAVGYTDWRKVVRKPRQAARCGLRGHAGPQPLCPVDDGRVHGHPLLHREAADLVGARGPTAGGRLRQESQGRHPDGQPGPRRQRLAAGLRIHQSGRGRRHQGVSHLDESSDLAAGRRPAGRIGPGARYAGLGGLDRPGPDASLQERCLSSVQLAGRRRFRLRGLGRHGLPHDRRHLCHHGAGLRGHGRTDFYDRPS